MEREKDVMHLLKKRLSIFAAILLSLSNAYAQDGTKILAGAGSQSCGAWLELRSNLSRTPNSYENLLAEAMIVSWGQGFYSGLNFARLAAKLSTPPIPEPPTFRAYLDKWCRDTPLSDVLTGVVDMHVVMRERTR